jgi:hypothetical protein
MALDPMMRIIEEYVSMCEGGWDPTLILHTVTERSPKVCIWVWVYEYGRYDSVGLVLVFVCVEYSNSYTLIPILYPLLPSPIHTLPYIYYTHPIPHKMMRYYRQKSYCYRTGR